MMRWVCVALVALFLGVSAGPGAAADAEKTPNGKPIFLKYRCRACHSIGAQGVKVTADEGGAGETDEKKPPDLSDVGLRHKADWMIAYLTKKEAIKGRKHEKKFRGSDAELKTLAGWLATLTEESAAEEGKADKSEKAKGGE